MQPALTTLLRGLLAGALAGLLTGLVGLVAAEPTLETAIARESGGGDELFSRAAQKGGLVLGLVLVGLALGALYALAYRQLPGDVAARPWRGSLGLALGGFGALYLVPFLRYPANPPGIGDPNTVGARTSAYLLCMALGIAVISAAVAGSRALARRGLPGWQRQPLVCVAAVIVIAVAYALLPAAAPAGDVPADLVWDFRLRSLGLQALLYALLGGTFGALAERAASQGVRAAHPTVAA